jgi:hypothetical protein
MVAAEVAEEIAKDSAAAAAVSPGNEMNDRNHIK